MIRSVSKSKIESSEGAARGREMEEGVMRKRSDGGGGGESKHIMKG